MFSHPEMLMPRITFRTAYESVKPNRFVSFRVFWIPKQMTENIEQYPWDTPRYLESYEELYWKSGTREWKAANPFPGSWNPLEHNRERRTTTWESTATWAMDWNTLQRIVPFPEFHTWGTDDPYQKAVRDQEGIELYNPPDPMIFHQHHPFLPRAKHGWADVNRIVSKALRERKQMRYTRVKPFEESEQIMFQDSALAHQYLDDLDGIEVGAAAHNRFNLAGRCRNVSDELTHDFHKGAQIRLCGEYAEADFFADAADLPFEDDSLDYVLSSHMIEHHPNPIAVFKEWDRVLKDGGLIFMIFPKRDALPADAERPISTLGEIVDAYDAKLTVESAPEVPGQGKGGHYYVYTLGLMREIINWCGGGFFVWDIIEALETDDKVGNGILIVARKRKVEGIPLPEEFDATIDETMQPEWAPDVEEFFGVDEAVPEAEPVPEKEVVYGYGDINNSDAINDTSPNAHSVSVPEQPAPRRRRRKKESI